MDARAVAGRLAIDFIPERESDWLVSGLVFTRHSPHIAHVPLMNVDAGSRSRLFVTITAPDGVKAASVEQTVPLRSRPVTTFLRADQSEFSALMAWRPEWEGMELLYHITAVDRAGNVSHLPARGDFAVRVGLRRHRE